MIVVRRLIGAVVVSGLSSPAAAAGAHPGDLVRFVLLGRTPPIRLQKAGGKEKEEAFLLTALTRSSNVQS
jgi:hypothetical protein